MAWYNTGSMTQPTQKKPGFDFLTSPIYNYGRGAGQLFGSFGASAFAGAENLAKGAVNVGQKLVGYTPAQPTQWNTTSGNSQMTAFNRPVAATPEHTSSDWNNFSTTTHDTAARLADTGVKIAHPSATNTIKAPAAAVTPAATATPPLVPATPPTAPVTPTTPVAPTGSTGGAYIRNLPLDTGRVPVSTPALGADPNRSQLQIEADNMRLYGDARGPGFGARTKGEAGPYPFDTGQTLDPTTGEPGTKRFDFVSDILGKVPGDPTGLSPNDIETAEEGRRAQAAAAIERAYGNKRTDQQLINKQQAIGARALGINLSGGTGNFSSTQEQALESQLTSGRNALGELEQEKQDALSKNDTDYAKRIEDRQAALATRVNELRNTYIEAYGKAQTSTEQERRFGLDTETEQRNLAYTNASINKMSEEGAQTAIGTMVDKFGSKAFAELSPESLSLLEQRAGYPKGTLSTLAESLDERALPLPWEMVEGTEHQTPAILNKATGRLEQRDDLWKASIDTGTTGANNENAPLTEVQAKGLADWWTNASPIKREDFWGTISKPERLALYEYLPQGGSGYQPGGKEDASEGISVLGEALSDAPDADRSAIEDFLLYKGIDPNSATIKGRLDAAYGSPNWFQRVGNAILGR